MVLVLTNCWGGAQQAVIQEIYEEIEGTGEDRLVVVEPKKKKFIQVIK